MNTLLYRTHMSLAWLLTGTLLTSCTTTMPVELKQYETIITTTKTESLNQPELRLTPHSDGLGWNVTVITRDAIHQDIAVNEIWNGYEYQLFPMLLWPYLCFFGIAAGTITAPFKAPDQPIGYRGFDLCFGAQDPKDLHDFVGARTVLRDRMLHREHPITTGTLELQWHPPQSDPLIVEVPVSNTTDGTALRLSWLATVIERNARDPALFRDGQGYGEIVYRKGNTTIRSSYQISSNLLRAARIHSAWRAPKDRWPATMVASLGPSQDWNNPPLSFQWLDSVKQGLVQRHLAMVVRGTELTRLLSTQATQLGPRYQGDAVRPGYLDAATVLVRVRSEQRNGTTHVYAQVFHVQDGSLLASLHLDAPDAFTDRLRHTLAAMLPDLLAPDTDWRGGWLIQ